MPRSVRLLAAASFAVSALVLVGCAPAETEPEPTVTETETTAEPTATEEPGADGITLPISCDFLFSDDQYDSFLESGLVLNPEFVQSGIDDGSFFGAGDELRPIVEALDPTTCVWTPPAESGFAIIVSYAEMDEATAAESVNTLTAAGFAQTTLLQYPLLDRVTAGDTASGDAGFSEAHFFGEGAWVGVYAWNESSALPTIEEIIPYLAR